MDAVAHGEEEEEEEVHPDEGREGRGSADRRGEAWLHRTSCTCSGYAFSLVQGRYHAFITLMRVHLPAEMLPSSVTT